MLYAGRTGQIISQNPLTGHYLGRAGFKPGNRVEIWISELGTLTLRFVDQSIVQATKAHQAFPHLRCRKAVQKWPRAKIKDEKKQMVFEA